MIVANGADSASVPANSLNNDAEFRLLNPGVNWPVQWYWPFLRSENNDDTLLVTNWLKTDHDANTFLAGNDPCGRQPATFWKGVQDQYPTDRFSSLDPSLTGYGYFPRVGTYANASRLAHRIINVAPDPQGGTRDGPSNPALGMFGILDLGTATAFGLPVANLSPAVTTSNLTGTGTGCTLAAGGATPVAADGAGLTAAYSLLAPDPLAAGANAYATQATSGAYPLAKMDYAIAPTSGVTDASHAAQIAQVLSWAATEGQEASNRPIGYPALPDSFRLQTAGLAVAVKNQTGETNPPPVAVPPLRDSGPAPLGVAASSVPLSCADLTSSFGASSSSTNGSTANLTGVGANQREHGVGEPGERPGWFGRHPEPRFGGRRPGRLRTLLAPRPRRRRCRRAHRRPPPQPPPEAEALALAGCSLHELRVRSGGRYSPGTEPKFRSSWGSRFGARARRRRGLRRSGALISQLPRRLVLGKGWLSEPGSASCRGQCRRWARGGAAGSRAR